MCVFVCVEGRGGGAGLRGYVAQVRVASRFINMECGPKVVEADSRVRVI